MDKTKHAIDFGGNSNFSLCTNRLLSFRASSSKNPRRSRPPLQRLEHRRRHLHCQPWRQTLLLWLLLRNITQPGFQQHALVLHRYWYWISLRHLTQVEAVQRSKRTYPNEQQLPNWKTSHYWRQECLSQRFGQLDDKCWWAVLQHERHLIQGWRRKLYWPGR